MDLMLRRWQIAADLAASGWLLLIASPFAAGEVVANHKHCLWRVTNAPAPVYLLGSVHALQPSDYIRTPVIEEAIKQSNQILFEMDPKDEAAFQQKFREAAKLPKGQLVQSKIHPQTYEYLRKITLSGMNEWHHLRPWAIAMILRNPTLGNPDYRWGVDHYVAQRAHYYGKATGDRRRRAALCRAAQRDRAFAKARLQNRAVIARKRGPRVWRTASQPHKRREPVATRTELDQLLLQRNFLRKV